MPTMAPVDSFEEGRSSVPYWGMFQTASVGGGPFGSLVDNTTWHLVDDIRALADHLAIERFVLSGGSWGSTLALAFATKFPARLLALILRGVITFRQRELDWFFVDGASRLFPDAHAAFLAPVPEAERGQPLAFYRRVLFGPEGKQRDRAVTCYRAWANRLGSLSPARSLHAEPEAKEPSDLSAMR